MATNFPVSLDSLTNPTSGNTLNSPSHSSQHANSNDAIEALEAKVGVDNSAVSTSLDYKVRINSPVGGIVLWATNTAPTGWLVCDGTAVSRSTYSGLFAILGTTYGAGDGSTTFNLPNLKGRVAVGRDSADSDFDVLGETRGSKTHTLTSAEMPSHTHIQDAHNHGITDSGHSHHTTNYAFLYQGAFANVAYTPDAVSGVSANYNTNTVTTGITINNTTAVNQNTGGGGAHNNIQPSIVLNYIIKH